ncbi:EamA family transporter [Ciceribacter sp. RN22]|uniref:EamA family transporter n=1 Tax=Ciceribacter sp. RN22 TaxID=2954932 RepID=UPI00209334BC|nr:EamA family transporter [Ciceribacter sp. RN22]MCO6178318.1 EamA family transporter [Ciceribacter sp. RN22]
MSPLHILMLVLVAAVWGFNFVVIKLGLDNFPPLLFSALRFLFAALPLAFFIRRPDVPWRLILGIGLMLGVVKFSFLFIGMNVGAPPGLASLLLQSQAFFTVLLAFLIYGDRPRPLQVAGMVLAFSGVALIASSIDGTFTVAGLVLVLAAAVAWACSNMLMKKVGKVQMLNLMVWVSLVPPIPLFIISALFEGWDRDLQALANLNLEGAGAVLFVAYGATVFGFAVWGAMISRYGVSTVAPFSLLVPVFGMSSAALVLGEDFGLLRVIAAALIVLGLVMNVFNPRWLARKAPVGEAAGS